MFIDSGDDEDEVIDVVLSPRWAENLTNSFKSWLCSVDGRLKNARCAGQCASQVLFVLKTVSPTEFNIRCLFDRHMLREEWLGKYDKLRKPGTIRSYLGALKLFYDFVLCDKPVVVHNTPSECYTMISVVQNWSAAYKERVKIRRFEKQVEDLNKVLTADELLQFDKSDLVEQCRYAIKKRLHSKNPIGLQGFTSCRDYIVSSLILSNATRPGALQNMTLHEFKSAASEDNVHLVSVMNHKTASTSGPAVLAFSSELYDECNVYIQKIRNSLQGVGTDVSDPVFISWNGGQMSSSLIGDQFDAFFKRATTHSLIERKERKLTATLVRKSFVSKVHSTHPEMKKDLSNMMNHSEDTAKRSYFLEEKSKNVAKTYTAMQRNMRKQDQEPPESKLTALFRNELDSSEKITLQSVKERADDLDYPLSTIQIRDKLRHMQAKRQQEKRTLPDTVRITSVPKEPQLDIPTSDDVSDDDADSIFRQQATVFTAAEDVLFKDHFKDLITNRASLIKSNTVIAVLRKKSMEAIKKKYSVHTILTKIRSLKRKHFK